MGKLRVLMVRSNPYDFDPHSYNVQEIGIGKALCDLGYDYDFLTFKKKDPKAWVFYECNDSKAQWIEVPRFRLLRWGINTSIYKKQFLSQYDLVICREYYQYCTYKICRNHPNVYIYNGPYWNMFMPNFFVLFMSTLNGLFGFLRPLLLTSKDPLQNGYLKPSIDLL